MSANIYAGKLENDPTFGECWGPVIPFNAWDFEIVADDADARVDRGESAFIENPDFVENAGMNLSNDNARFLFSTLGFKVSEDGTAEFPIEDVQKAAMIGLNGAASKHTEEDQVLTGDKGATIYAMGIPEGYMRTKIRLLLAMITTGRELGATHILVC